MRKLTGNILKTFLTHIPSLIISIITGIFLTRLLGVEGKGVYAIFYANIEIMVMLFTIGCDMGIIYFGSNKRISPNKIQGIATYILLIFAPLISLIVLGFDVDFLFPNKYDSLFFKLFLLGDFILRLNNGILAAFLKSVKSFRSVNRVTLFSSVLNVATFAIMFYLNAQGVIEVDLKLIFMVRIILLFIVSIVWVAVFVSKIEYKPQFKLSFKSDIFPFFKYIFPVFIGLIINFLNYRFDIWLVSYFVGNIYLGLYVLAVNFAQFILLYSKIIGGVLMPYLSEDNHEQRVKYFTIYSRINFISVMVVVTILAFIGDTLIVFLYGKEFTGSGEPFKILLIGMVFTAMSQLFSIMLFSKGKNNVALFANTIGLIVTIVLDVLLIPVYGIMGAAVATSASYFALFLVLLVYLLGKEKINPIDLFLIRKSDFKEIFQRD